MIKIIAGVITLISVYIISVAPAVAIEYPEENNIQRSGCCSHHNGACQCLVRHVICCDGWEDSSCGC